MKKFLLLLFWPGLILALDSSYVVVVSVENQVEIRQPFAKEWQPASAGTILKDLHTIKCGASSHANLKAYDGQIFVLRPNSQIEARDLKKLDRNELVMELTALELQKLPREKGRLEKPEAFVLHGSIDESNNTETVELQNYSQLEHNGAMALFSQNFIPGFILKYNRTLLICPQFQSQKLNKALLESLRIMNMTARLNELLEKNEGRKIEK